MKSRISDEARSREVSRQYIWAERKQALGMCRICGDRREHYKLLCDRCTVKVRITKRQQKANKSNAHGARRGPKPLVPDSYLDVSVSE